jgi:FkbM family methyltransferase
MVSTVRLRQFVGNSFLKLYAHATKSINKNTISYDWGGKTFKFQYTDEKTLKTFRNLISEGYIQSENLPLSLFDRSDECDAVIDVGAHYGIYSVIMAVCNPSAQLYAYEPVREPREILTQNLEVNGLWPEAKISDTVVAGRSGDEVPFYEDPRVGSERHSTTEAEGKVMTTRRTTALSDSFDVEGISNPFLKIDAEGKEGEIVEDIVSQSVTASLSGIVELHPDKLKDYTVDDIQHLFEKHGFDCEFICESAPAYKHDRSIYYFSDSPEQGQ